MRNFFKNTCVLGFILIVIIFSIIVGIVNVKNPEATLGENIINVTVTPIQSFFTWIGDGISDFFGYFGDKDDLRKENARLKKENCKIFQTSECGAITIRTDGYFIDILRTSI